MTEGIAILRKCRCCQRWRSIDAFTSLGLFCQACLQAICMPRMQITPKGRAWLDSERRADTAA